MKAERRTLTFLTAAILAVSLAGACDYIVPPVEFGTPTPVVVDNGWAGIVTGVSDSGGSLHVDLSIVNNTSQWSAMDVGATTAKVSGKTCGKVFVGTNNANPRNPAIQGDRGVLMAFRESDGEFLWQAVSEKLESGMQNDWPEQGVCSSPAVDGKRLYYVTNRGELVALDTEGFRDGRNDGVQDEKHTGPTDADIVWKLDMMKELGVYQHNMANSSPVVWGSRMTNSSPPYRAPKSVSRSSPRITAATAAIARSPAAWPSSSLIGFR
jgi:hypothetical protein